MSNLQFNSDQVPIKSTAFSDLRAGRKTANEDMLDSSLYRWLANPSSHVFEKALFSWSDFRVSVASGDVYYYSYSLGDKKDVILFSTELVVSEGPVIISSIAGATFTPGTPVDVLNAWSGQPNAMMEVTAGATSVVGGIENIFGYFPGGGNKIGGLSEVGGLSIAPRGSSGLLKIHNQGSGTNTIQIINLMAEIDLDRWGLR